MIHTTTWGEIKAGKVTDIYFERTKEILEAKGIDRHVRAEFMAKGLPQGFLLQARNLERARAEVLRKTSWCPLSHMEVCNMTYRLPHRSGTLSSNN